MSSIQKQLVEIGLSANDLVHELKPNELLSTAFKRQHNGKDYLDLKGDDGKFHTFLVNDLIQYIEDIENVSSDIIGQFKLALIIPLEDIQADMDRFEMGSWETLRLDEQRELLHEYGIDKAHNFIQEEMIYRKKNNQLTSGTVIVGQERLDKKWIRSNRASFEAKIYREMD